MDQDFVLLKRAKMYMDKLSDGVDPVSGEILPNDTALNNERLARCFKFISEVLTQLIDLGGLSVLSEANKPADVSKNQKLRPFELPNDKRKRIFLNAKPIDVSEFTRSINKHISVESMEKLKGNAFATWLLAKGYLEKEGSTRKPTHKGLNIGISTHLKQTSQLMYSREAQQFLLDNLDEIIMISNGQK